MNLEELLAMDRLRAAEGLAQPQPRQGAEQASAFEAVLEELARLGADAPEEGGGGTSDVRALATDLARADAQFANLMDLRRRLEDAFRSRQS